MGTASILTPRAARLPVFVDSVFVAEEARTAVTLVNVTNYGFMAESGRPICPGQVGTLILPDGSELTAEIRWAAGNRFGARFAPAIRTFTLGRILALQAGHRDQAVRAARLG